MSGTQSLIEEEHFINLHTGVVTVLGCVDSSHNNPTVSSWIWDFRLNCMIRHFFCIIEDPDTLSIIGSNVV